MVAKSVPVSVAETVAASTQALAGSAAVSAAELAMMQKGLP